MGKTLGKALVKAAALLLAACLLGGCALEKWISAGQERPKASQGLETAGTLTEILSGLLALPENGREPADSAEEMKAVWVSYLDLSPLLVGKSREEFAASAEELVQNSKDLGMNTLIVQVRPFGDSFYPSQYFPWSKWASGEVGKPLDYDPIQILREEAEKQGLEFHGWLNPMRGMSESEISLVPPEYPIRQWYDDPALWAENLMIADGNIYLNPASADARKLIADGAAEVQETYGTDGIHIDDYFYPPDMDFSVDAPSYAQYQAEGGTLDQARWRRENTLAMVRELSEAVHKASPESQFGVSPRGSMEQNFRDLYIDVEQWMREGLMDYIAPQLYYGFENGTLPFAETARQWDSLAEESGVPMVVGLAAYKVGKTDRYAGAGASEWMDSPDLLARQIEFSRELPSYGGIMFFRYDSIANPPKETADAAAQAKAYWQPLLLESTQP